MQRRVLWLLLALAAVWLEPPLSGVEAASRSRTASVIRRTLHRTLSESDQQRSARVFSATPARLFPLKDGETAPTFVELEGNPRNGFPCKEGFGCVFPNGVCCLGGDTCCEHACTKDTPPQCTPSPSQLALQLAKEKMEEEGNKEIQYEHYQKTRNTYKAKVLKELEEKKRNEDKIKRKAITQEQKDKKKKETEENQHKNEATKKEDQWKQKEQLEKATNKAKQKMLEEKSKTLVIKADNYEVKKNTIVAPANRLKFKGAYTYMLWIRPSGVQPSMSNIFFKGSNAGERNPAVFFYPGLLRLKISSGTIGNPNNGVDPDEELPLHKWTHVAFTHEANALKVYFNGKLRSEAMIPEPLANTGDLYASSPWSEQALCHISDFRYLPRAVSAKEIEEAFNGRRFQEIKSSVVILLSKNLRPRKGYKLAPASEVKRASAVTWMFWIRPRAVIHQWSNVFQKGARKEERQISVSLYPGSTRLHIRSATARGHNDGADPEAELNVWEWTHVAITHKEGEFVVYYNGVEAVRADLPQPLHNDGPVYMSEPYLYDAAEVDMADLVYVDTVIDVVAVRTQMERKRYDASPPKEIVIAKEEFKPSPKRLLMSGHDLGDDLTAYTWTFWVRPISVNKEWANLFHKGDADAQRNIAVWFYPGTTRLHIRSGTRSSWNDGLDPVSALPMQTWTHVTIVHMHSRMEVYFNAVSQGQEWKWQPNTNAGSLRASSEYYPPADCALSDLRLFQGVIPTKQIEAVFAENKKGSSDDKAANTAEG